jgi:hypothetical protein
MKKIYSLLAGLLLTASVWAQAPQKMSYQAVIRNSSNALLTSTSVGMQISILQGSSTGTAVYVETQTVSTNANGLVSLEIGTGTPVTGTFASINWANGPYFIKTETDPTGGTAYTIVGTNELMSVPYALFAANGTPGATGAQGIPGIPGIPGNNGTDGTNGTNGTNGLSAYDVWIGLGNVGTQTDFINSLTGPQGNQGLPGTNGAAGAAGVDGTNGTNGIDGADGSVGATGAAGVDGTNGTNGTDGTNGINGLAGTNGTNGTDGTNGAVGATGPAGAAGVDGTNGTNGIDGVNGADGAAGPQGNQGLPGTNGAVGATGSQGQAGTNGQGGVTTAGSGINVTGAGTIASPYVVSTTSPCGLAIGQTYQGGIIFYLDASGCHGLISAPIDQSTGIQWWNGVYTDTYASGSGLFDGDGNCYRINRSQGNCGNCNAAGLCLNLTLGGYSDWYLPSKYELNLMYRNIGQGNALGLGNVGGFANNGYWSSTECDNLNAWAQGFSSGTQYVNDKTVNRYVRSFRAF